MRQFWDDRARVNAAWYVDTTLDFEHPDMDQFWRQAEPTMAIGLDEPPAVLPDGHGLAVEIGSGLGRNCTILARRFDRVVGVDIAPEMVRRSTELVGDEQISFELVDGASLAPIDSGSADLVFSFTVFQHIPSPAVIDRYIAEAGRVLRPGGVMAFQWNNEPGHRRWVIRRWVLSSLQRVGLRREKHRRNAAQFLGSRVPLTRITSSLDDAGMDLVATRDLGSLFAWAWARKR